MYPFHQKPCWVLHSWLGTLKKEQTHNEAGIRWGSLTTVNQNLSVFIRYITLGKFSLSRRCLGLAASPRLWTARRCHSSYPLQHIDQLFVNTHVHSQGKFAVSFSLACMWFCQFTMGQLALLMSKYTFIQNFTHSGLPLLPYRQKENQLFPIEFKIFVIWYEYLSNSSLIFRFLDIFQDDSRN